MNANKDKALFLGTEIFRLRRQSFSSSQFGYIIRKGGEVRLESPKKKIVKNLTNKGFLKNNIPEPRFL